MASPAAAPHATATNWSCVLLAVGAGVVCAFQIGKAPPALPGLREGLGLGLVAAGWVIAMYAFVTAGIGVVGGALADAAGHRRAVLFGLACLAAGSAAGAAAQTPALLLAGRFIEGIGYVPIMVAAPALILQATGARDARLAFGIWGANMPAGTAVMVLLAPIALAYVGWQGLWLANALLAALYALLFAWGTRRLARRADGFAAIRPRALAGDVAAVLRAPAPLLLALFYPTYTGNYLAIFGFLPTLLIERMGVGRDRAALLTAIAISVNVLGNLAGGWLRQRGVPLRWTLAGGSALMGALALGLFDDSLLPAIRYGFAVALGLCCGVIPASALDAAPMFAPEPRLVATAQGLLVQGSNIGMLLWPPALAAVVAAAGGWHAAPWLVCGSSMVGVALGWIVGGYERVSVQGGPVSRR